MRADPHDRQTAFVTLSGFRWAEAMAHVWKTTDLGANARFVNDPCTVDDGLPDGMNAQVDMGSYEFQPPCPSDLDCSGDVGVGDLLALLAGWGTPDADLTGDGNTDIGDLLALLAAWGPCT